MFDKIIVNDNAVGIVFQINPIRFYVDDALALLQNDDVAGHFRAGIRLESGVRQANCAEKLRALGDIFSHLVVCLIHRAFGRDEHDHAARTHLVKGFGKEIIVNHEILRVVPLVIESVIPERNIADHDIKMPVGETGLLKALHRDIGILVKLLGNAAGQRVEFHTVEFGLRHAFGE